MNHSINLKTEEIMMIIGAIETCFKTPNRAIDRLLDNLKGRMRYDLKIAEMEHEKWKEMDDDL